MHWLYVFHSLYMMMIILETYSYRNHINVYKYQLSATTAVLILAIDIGQNVHSDASLVWRADKGEMCERGHTVHTERPPENTDSSMDVLHCPRFGSSHRVLAAVPSCSIILRSPNLSLFYSWKFCFYTSLSLLTLLSASVFPSFSPFFWWLKHHSGVNYINNCKVWKSRAKNWGNCINLPVYSPLIDVRSRSLHV